MSSAGNFYSQQLGILFYFLKKFFMAKGKEVQILLEATLPKKKSFLQFSTFCLNLLFPTLLPTLSAFSRSASNIVQRCYLRTTPHFCSECTFWRKKSWEMPSISIFFQALLRGTFTQQASLTLIVLALERYLTSVHPLTFEGFCSTKVSMVAQLIRLLGKSHIRKKKDTPKECNFDLSFLQ